MRYIIQTNESLNKQKFKLKSIKNKLDKWINIFKHIREMEVEISFLSFFFLW